jgi:glycine/D-amino acid oxidase-like deaminating enzyme
MENSIWTENLTLPQFAPLDGELRTDVLIVGGGMAGLLCAHALQEAGVDYRLIEGDRILHGVTRNTTAKITTQHGLVYHKLLRRFGAEKALQYFRANEQALERYAVLAQNVDCDFQWQDNTVYTTDFTDALVEEMSALEELGIPAEFVDHMGLPMKTAGGVRFRNQAQFHPLKFASAIAKDLRIYEQTSAKAFEGNTVQTNRGTITAKKIIIATHFPMINKHGSYFLKMYQSRSYVLALENAPMVDGMFVDESDKGLSFRNDGDLLLLGGGGHRTGKPGGGWKVLEDFAKQHYPDAKIRSRWATQDCMTLDDLPYVGQYSSRTPDLYVATGFNKWGMTNSMVAAQVLCDLVQGRENDYADLFSPSRSILRPQLACNAMEAVKSLLTFTKPRCPHMGCALHWNQQEHSWDCPCHGSRFTKDGKLLDNPATDDLKTGRSG